MVAASSALPAGPMWRMIALISNKFHKHRINITHVASGWRGVKVERGWSYMKCKYIELKLNIPV